MIDTAPQDQVETRRWWHRVEDGFQIAVLLAMVLLPVGAVLVRWTTGYAVAGANLWVQALNLWVAFLGGALAARTQEHLRLSTGELLGLRGWKRDLVAGFTSAVATAVAAYLAYASVRLVVFETESTTTLWGGVPMWVMYLAMPLGFGIMAVRFAWRGNRTWPGRAVALAIVGAAALLALVPGAERAWVVWSGFGVLLAAIALGAPLFTIMGGMAMLLFYGAPVPISLSAVPAETVRLVADPTIAALPLFTLTGFLLARGGSSQRIVDLFDAWFGWLPGGVPTAAVLVCAFFTTFTGASGVTILAIGGLLVPALEGAGYSRAFSIGLVTASGSIGALFPPSLPVILYGASAQVPITDLFLGGAVPGALLVVLMIAYSVSVDLRERGPAHFFRHHRGSGLPAGRAVAGRLRIMGRTLWRAKWEFALPVLVVGGIFGGYVTLFEAAACTAAYALVLETLIHRDLGLRTGLPEAFLETAALMGAVLVILGVALGLTSYLVDADVPTLARDWVQARVESRLAFILLLNLALVVVGALMDIYSAIVVVVPLMTPIAAAFGIHPIHLGVLFMANLQLGYLVPPMGENLFLSAMRFKEPLVDVWRHTLPFIGILAVGVLIVSYVPAISLWPFADEAPVEQPDFWEEVEAPPEEPTGEQPTPSSQDLMRELEAVEDTG